jgi:hypothetical protein
MPCVILNRRSLVHQQLAKAAASLCRPDGLAALAGESTTSRDYFRWTPEEAIGHILCGLLPRVDPIETYVVRDYYAPGLDAVVVVASPHETVNNLSKAWRSAAAIRMGCDNSKAGRDLLNKAADLRKMASTTYAEPSEELEQQLPGITRQYEGMRKYFTEEASSLEMQATTTFPSKLTLRTEQVLRFLQRTPHWTRNEQLTAINREFPPELRFEDMNLFEVAIHTARKNKLATTAMVAKSVSDGLDHCRVKRRLPTRRLQACATPLTRQQGSIRSENSAWRFSTWRLIG